MLSYEYITLPAQSRLKGSIIVKRSVRSDWFDIPVPGGKYALVTQPQPAGRPPSSELAASWALPDYYTALLSSPRHRAGTLSIKSVGGRNTSLLVALDSPSHCSSPCKKNIGAVADHWYLFTVATGTSSRFPRLAPAPLGRSDRAATLYHLDTCGPPPACAILAALSTASARRRRHSLSPDTGLEASNRSRPLLVHEPAKSRS